MLLFSIFSLVLYQFQPCYSMPLPSSVPYHILQNAGQKNHKVQLYTPPSSSSNSLLTDYDSLSKNRNQKKSSIIHTIITILQSTTQRFVDGTTNFIQQTQEAEQIKKIKAKYGESALTYTQFKLLEQSKEDFGKMFRICVTIPISPQIFFYSYLVFPMLSAASPWAWRQFPSTFDENKKDKIQRYRTIKQRRVTTLFSVLNTLLKETSEEGSSEENQIMRKKQIEQLKSCLYYNNNDGNVMKALSIIEEWLYSSVDKNIYKKYVAHQQLSTTTSTTTSTSTTNTNTKQKPTKKSLFSPSSNSANSDIKLNMKFDTFPVAVITDIVKALGMDGMPNVPLIKRLNANELSRYCDKVSLCVYVYVMYMRVC